MKPGTIHMILWRKYELTLKNESNLFAPVSKGRRALICYAGSMEGFVDNAPFLCGKGISKCYVDYHQNMNGEVLRKFAWR